MQSVSWVYLHTAHQADGGSGQLIVKRTKTVIQARGVAIAAVLNPGMVKDEMLFGAV